jgi:HEAT repeat protein
MLQRQEERQHAQAELDAGWQRLTTNDPETILDTLEDAFADNEAPAAAINCSGSRVAVAMKFGHPGSLPDRKPAVTPAGRPTLHKRTKTEGNQLYLASLGSNLLATVRETLAVCPGIDEVDIMVVRQEASSSKTPMALAAIYAGTFKRDHFADRTWSGIDPTSTLVGRHDALVCFKGRTDEVVPLDLSDEPELQQVLEQIGGALDLQPLKPKRPRREAPLSPAPVGSHQEVVSPPVPSERAASTSSVDASGPTSSSSERPDPSGEPDKVQPHRSKTVERLVQALSDPDSDVRWEALSQLRDRLEPSLFGPLIKAVRDPDNSVRQLAVGALADMKTPRAKVALMRLAVDPDADVRYEAVSGLREILDPTMTHVMVRAAADRDGYVRRMALGCLAELKAPDAKELLLSALGDEDADTRYEALSGLQDLLDPSMAAAIVAAASDPDTYVRRTALSSLAQLKVPQARDVLIAGLADEDAEVRYEAASGLSEMLDVGMVDPLLAVIGDDDDYVRRTAIRALGEIRDPRAVSGLIVALRDHNPDVRYEAVSALKGIGDPEAVTSLQPMLHDSSADVRRAALQALEGVEV